MKKIGMILLAFLIFFSSFDLKVFADVTPYNKDHTKIVLRSLGERMGIMWTNESLEATSNYLITKAHIEERDNHSVKQKAQMLADWSNYIKNTNFVDGVATAFMGPEEWYDGMHSIYEAMQDIKLDEPMEMYAPNGCMSPHPNQPIPDGAVFFVEVKLQSSNNPRIYYFDKVMRYATMKNGHAFLPDTDGIRGMYLYPWQGNLENWRSSGGFETMGSNVWQVPESTFKLVSYGAVNSDNMCMMNLEPSQIINGDYIEGDLITNINNYGNTKITTNMPIKYSNVINNYNYDEPLNSGLTKEEIFDLFKEMNEEEPDEPEPLPEPENKPEGSSWWEWLISPISKAIEGLGTLLSSVITALADLVTAIGDLLISLVVPDGEVLTEQFGSVKDTFDNKIPIINQLNDFFRQVSESTINETKPTFDVNIPEEWGGGTFPIIDFTVYDQYRDWVLNFIRFIAWFVFLKRLYNRLPRIIY